MKGRFKFLMLFWISAVSCVFGAAQDTSGNPLVDSTDMGDIDMDETTVGDFREVISPNYAFVSNTATTAYALSTNALTRKDAVDGFTEWSIDATGSQYEGMRLTIKWDGADWKLYDANGNFIDPPSPDTDPNATSLTFSVQEVTANRIRIPTIADIPTNNVQLINGMEYVTESVTNGLARLSDITTNNPEFVAAVLNSIGLVTTVSNTLNDIVTDKLRRISGWVSAPEISINGNNDAIRNLLIAMRGSDPYDPDTEAAVDRYREILSSVTIPDPSINDNNTAIQGIIRALQAVEPPVIPALEQSERNAVVRTMGSVATTNSPSVAPTQEKVRTSEFGSISEKRYALFILELNQNGDTGFTGFELEASDQNFSADSNFFGSTSDFKSDKPSGDGFRVYVLDSDKSRKRVDLDWENFASDGKVKQVAVIVSPLLLNVERKHGAIWLSESNDNLVWNYRRLIKDRGEAEVDNSGKVKPIWRMTSPVKWFTRIPRWAIDQEYVQEKK